MVKQHKRSYYIRSQPSGRMSRYRCGKCRFQEVWPVPPPPSHHSAHRLPEYAIPVSVSALSHATKTCSWRPAKERAYMGTSFSSSLFPAASLPLGNGMHCSRPVPGARPCDLKLKHTMIVPGRSNITSCDYCPNCGHLRASSTGYPVYYGQATA